MASWRRVNGQVLVYSYYVDGERSDRPKQIPRAKTKHLDPEPDHNVEYWVKNWSLNYEKHKKRTEESINWENSRLNSYIKQFANFQLSRGKAESTVKQHVSMLNRFGIPFFLQQTPPLPDPNQWPGASIRLLTWLESEPVSASKSTIKQVNIALRLFYKYLTEEGIIQTGANLRLRNPIFVVKNTPLKSSLTPDEVISWATFCKQQDIKVLGLVGFFFALRPQELFGMGLSDFRAGNKVEQLDVGKTMVEAGLFSKLAIYVDRQRNNQGKMTMPKAGSKGWVCCFDDKAAKMIVEILNISQGVDPLIHYNNRECYKRWRKFGIPGTTLKDLRRASLFYLGHHTRLGEKPINLMRYARHKEIETTMLYVRQPEEELKNEFNGILDLGA